MDLKDVPATIPIDLCTNSREFTTPETSRACWRAMNAVHGFLPPSSPWCLRNATSHAHAGVRNSGNTNHHLCPPGSTGPALAMSMSRNSEPLNTEKDMRPRVVVVVLVVVVHADIPGPLYLSCLPSAGRNSRDSKSCGDTSRMSPRNQPRWTST